MSAQRPSSSGPAPPVTKPVEDSNTTDRNKTDFIQREKERERERKRERERERAETSAHY